MMSDKNFYYPDWDAPDHIKSIQTYRSPGFSAGCYSSFNLSDTVGDSLEAVNKNLSLLSASLPSSPYWLSQVHDNQVVELPNNEKVLIADASFTKEKRVVCTVRTADCLPILLTDKKGTFVAAVHAGWRSLASGIIENTLSQIKSNYGIIAWLGPSISQTYYEVGQEVYDTFTNFDRDSHSGFIKLPNNKYLLSMPQIALKKLKKNGVKKIFGTGVNESFCTYRDSHLFYSHRRDSDTGRMATLIWIQGH